MWIQALTLTCLVFATLGEVTAPGIDRIVSNGVTSMGYRMVYGNEDMTVINEVVSDVEKSVLKKKTDLHDFIKPLPAQDVKCLMSVDRYCSKEMGAMKSIIIQAIKEDCVKCSTKEKDEAGKVIASMMANDPVAWKLFLTRLALQIKPSREDPKYEEYNLKEVGEPEEIVGTSKTKFTRPGFHVRVKRFQAERIL